MQQSYYALSILSGLLLLILILLAALIWVMKQLRDQNLRQTHLMTSLLMEERSQSQDLLNQLRAEDVATLMGLNQATLPEGRVASNSDVQGENLLPGDLGSLINEEEELARQGYETGEVSDDLAASGWSPPFIKRGTSEVYES